MQRLSEGFLGTGIIIQKQANQTQNNPTQNQQINYIYTVITNNHVIDFVDTPYQIQTPDGVIYNATIIENDKLENYDLGILQFTTNQTYQIAKFGKSAQLNIEDEIFVGGFVGEKGEMIFSHGRLSLVLAKPLEGGYQIGYTNDIQKGMSGGAVLNVQGEVVGINGLHKNPLWEAPDFYFDGSKPEAPLQEKITRSSWGIPIETLILISNHRDTENTEEDD
ncbi:MAG: trypsin-like peptidase domain-containing protein [Sphaerospermopsis sp. SIO1G2]|nr:trypsin-like peptidase domain-containing protein [Sphaerospermopsis sp. SIO1G2]